MLQVSPATAPVRRGECYVRVTLLMGGFAVGRLIAGYVTDGATLAWPGGKFENFTDGAGYLRVVVGTDPAAGANVLEVVPTNVRWRVRTMIFSFVTSATVADRAIRIIIDNVANTLCTTNFGAVQPASTTTPYYLSPVTAALETGAAEGKRFTIPDELILLQGWRIRTGTIGLQADDDYGAPSMYVEEWIEE